MNFGTINIKGAGGIGKAARVKGLLSKFNLAFIAIQETQFRDLSLSKIRRFWDSSSFEFSKVDADGRSGGLLSLWNPLVFKKELELKSQNFLIIKGKLTGENEDLVVVNVYGSTSKANRIRMWEELLEAKNQITGDWIMLGDFNEVRFPEDRFNSEFDVNGAICFNNFISRGGFLEYNMTGRKFTFLSGDRKNLSKIDRVLVCGNFMNKWPNASLLALNRDISDHSRLILTTVNNSFGPSPFRLFNSWFSLEGFDEAVRRGLDKLSESRFKDEEMSDKLKAVKEELKKWRKNKKEEEERVILEAKNKLEHLDEIAENRQLTEEEIKTWQSCKSKIKECQEVMALDMQQKARLRWVELGDENTNFFHSIVNNHIARNRIAGLWIEGVWVSDPIQIKAQFLLAFKEKFKEPVRSRPRIGPGDFKKLSEEQSIDLISPFTIEEVRSAFGIVELINRLVHTGLPSN
ncbi:uncharacterized protein LOC110924645 [Helianthus annuus]|uniref:uncharacterized protein LOC110924645 n=1 Tax=Helianthus annuus TaxID=4232 RepID=UPI000B8F0CE1|nr:uncharacterized protein LOC110924645 [Helianthus annuus]